MAKPYTIGILGPSEIAFRRFVPALIQSKRVRFMGVAIADQKEWSDTLPDDDLVIQKEKEKAQRFIDLFGGTIFDSYQILLESEVDAVYIPLPPALHYKWALKALRCHKHVLLEKPFTLRLKDSQELINVAQENNLAIHENYAFIFHKQIQEINKLLLNGIAGEIRLIRSTFGFPYRGQKDFRYNKSLGGGALFDCGGYPLKLADYLLGSQSKIASSVLLPAKGHDVDVYGNATLVNQEGLTAQIAFGMDNSYKCDLEIWGSEAYISTNRIFTSPADYETTITITQQSNVSLVKVLPDDHFLGSIEQFTDCMMEESFRLKNYKEIEHQSKLLHQIFYQHESRKL